MREIEQILNGFISTSFNGKSSNIIQFIPIINSENDLIEVIERTINKSARYDPMEYTVNQIESGISSGMHRFIGKDIPITTAALFPIGKLAHMNSSEKGKQGEAVAIDWLMKQGYVILESNWRNRHLEIDVIAQKDNEIIFIEVKTRFSKNWGAPWEAVNAKKRRLIIAAAEIYIHCKRCKLEPRFDILSILVSGGVHDVLHIPHAFHPVRI